MRRAHFPVPGRQDLFSQYFLFQNIPPRLEVSQFVTAQGTSTLSSIIGLDGPACIRETQEMPPCLTLLRASVSARIEPRFLRQYLLSEHEARRFSVQTLTNFPGDAWSDPAGFRLLTEWGRL